jgi:hypothetical protein
MHPFPPRSELAFLIGKEVGHITLDPWGTQFCFSDGGAIVVEGAFEHVDASGVGRLHQQQEAQDRGPVFLRELLQRTINDVAVEPLLLTLSFDGGAILRIHSDERPYECGQIHRTDDRTSPLVF